MQLKKLGIDVDIESNFPLDKNILYNILLFINENYRNLELENHLSYLYFDFYNDIINKLLEYEYYDLSFIKDLLKNLENIDIDQFKIDSSLYTQSYLCKNKKFESLVDLEQDSVLELEINDYIKETQLIHSKSLFENFWRSKDKYQKLPILVRKNLSAKSVFLDQSTEFDKTISPELIFIYENTQFLKNN